RNLWTCEIRGGIFVEDNDDVFKKREVSLIGFEETGVSFAAATCTGYDDES
ncbi:hypothetical protein A2U01_0054833, partial [Trifolium medium]|nr:hypothetical protein [Trifolium medium]